MKRATEDQVKPLKILLAHNRYLIRGGEREVFEAECNLLEANGQVVETYVDDNKRVAKLGKVRTAARAIWSQKTYQSIRNRLSDGSFDIVHVHNFFPLISPAIFYAARAERIPVVQTLHNYRLICVNGLLFRSGAICEDCVGRLTPWPGIYHACFRDSRSGSASVAAMLSIHRALKSWDEMVDTYIALSNFSRRKFIEGGLPGAKIVVKSNFMVKDPGQGSGQGRFALYVGRLSAEKGVETMLAAWKILGETVPLKIIGDGPLRDIVKSASEALPALEYLGRLDNEQVLSLMQNARFLVFPSLCYENSPMIVVEACATGLPILASNLGNTGKLVQTRHVGLTFEPGAAAELANQVLNLVNSPEAAAAMRSAARATFELQFSSSGNYRLLKDIYAMTLAKSGYEA